MRAKTLLSLAPLFVGATLACGSSAGGAAEDDAGAAGSPEGGPSGDGKAPEPPPQGPAGVGEVTRDGDLITAKIRMQAVPPGAEDHACVTLELPFAAEAWVPEVTATLEGGSHHLIVDRRAPGGALSSVATSCTPTQGADASRLMIAQQAETRVTLPEGVAFRMEPKQALFLQLHYLNTDPEPHDIEGSVTVRVPETVPAGLVEAKSIFTGSFAIDLPPQSPGESRSFYPPKAATGVRNVFAVTSHTHRLGIRSTIERVADAAAPESPPIHESLHWEEPPLTQFSPPLEFDGSDGLRLICRYQNTTGARVGFGTSATQEMCFMWVYYFDR